ncbi:MAG: PLP-dependent aminotransferase family protein, partial [Ruminiclostridium sp.]|nr:PLP-dependent aminotransferase family protein [Ruminiclostridium sp.]
YFPLRESVSMLLKNSGLDFPLDNIQIISGAQQGLDLISKALLRQGDRIITESPTYTGAIALFKSRGARIADIQMDTDGPDLDILEFNLKQYRPRIIYTIPTFQNPTGRSYSMEKRLAVLELAELYNCYIIEDDYVSDLDFEGRRYQPLKALDKYSRVIFIKSFSKIFMPGLRLGFMIVPSALTENLLTAKHITDISTSGLIQRAFDLYIRRGYWDKHFYFMYEIYKERYEKTTEALSRYLSGNFSFTGPGGGLNLWLGLPYGFPVNTLIKHAADHNIVFAPGRIFYSGNSPQTVNNIRLSFAAVYTEQIEAGIKDLCTLMNKLQNQDFIQRNVRIL